MNSSRSPGSTSSAPHSLSTPRSAVFTLPAASPPWVRVAHGHTHPFSPCDTTGHPNVCQAGAEPLDTALWQDTTLLNRYRQGQIGHVVRPSAFPSDSDLALTSSNSGAAWAQNAVHYTADSLWILRINPGLKGDRSRIQSPGMMKKGAGSCRLY